MAHWARIPIRSTRSLCYDGSTKRRLKGFPNQMPKPFTDLSVKIPIPRFETSLELTGASLKIFLKSFWFISKVVLVVYLPASLLKEIALKSDNTTNSEQFDNFINLVFDALITPAVIFGIAQLLKKKTFPSTFDAYRFGWKKWGLVWAREFKGCLLTVLRLVMLVVPGILAGIAYALIPYAVCFESNTQKSSLRRSRELSIGRRWLILSSGCLIGLPIFLFASIPELWADLSSPSLLFNIFSISIDVFFNCLGNILIQTLVIAYLLIYLKAVKSKNPIPKETWLLGWAK